MNIKQQAAALIIAPAFITFVIAVGETRAAPASIAVSSAEQILAAVDACIASRGPQRPEFARLIQDGWKESADADFTFSKDVRRIRFTKLADPAAVSCSVRAPADFSAFIALAGLMKGRFGYKAPVTKDGAVIWSQSDFQIRVRFLNGGSSNSFVNADVIYPTPDAK